MSQEISELDQRRNELLDKERLTDKQAAILAAFEENPEASYADIADTATNLLPDDMGVTGSYAGEQIKQRRPDWFDDRGRRRPPEDMDEEPSGERTTQTQEEAEPDETGDGDTDADERVSDEVQQLAGGEQVDMEAPDEAQQEQVDEGETQYDEARVAEVADWYDVSEQQAQTLIHAEEETGIELTGREGLEQPAPEVEGVAVGLEEDEWLRLTAFLHLFADTDVGARHEEKVMNLAGEITRQALEQ